MNDHQACFTSCLGRSSCREQEALAFLTSSAQAAARKAELAERAPNRSSWRRFLAVPTALVTAPSVQKVF